MINVCDLWKDLNKTLQYLHDCNICFAFVSRERYTACTVNVDLGDISNLNTVKYMYSRGKDYTCFK